MLLINAAKLPEPPSSGLITRYVLENPLPLGIGLLLVAIVVGWLGLRDGTRSKLTLAGVMGLLSLLVFVLGYTITTAAEHGKQVTRQLVDRIVVNDLTGTMRLFSDEATANLGSPNNPGMGIEFIRNGFDYLSRYTIQNNTIRMLDGFNESGDTAIVHLGCWTEVDTTVTPSTWILRIQQQPDGQWKIIRLTCVSIGNQTPKQSWMK